MKMGEVRLKCEKDIQFKQRNTIAYLYSFRNSLASQNQGKLKAQLTAAENHLVKALAFLSACEKKCKKDSECREEVEEAISWYNRVLGFRIECGHGIQFIFTIINPNDPKEESYFTIRHENDVYSLLDCDPYLNDTKELITELSKSNGLFQFVWTMREKFEATTRGTNPNFVTLEQDTSTVSGLSASAPVSSISSSRSQSPVKQKALQAWRC